MAVVKTSSKCQLVIPKDIREKLGIKPGKKVMLRLVDNHVEISAFPDDPIEALCGSLKGGQSMTRELLKERKQDNQVDEKSSL